MNLITALRDMFGKPKAPPPTVKKSFEVDANAQAPVTWPKPKGKIPEVCPSKGRQLAAAGQKEGIHFRVKPVGKGRRQ